MRIEPLTFLSEFIEHGSDCPPFEPEVIFKTVNDAVGIDEAQSFEGLLYV